MKAYVIFQDSNSKLLRPLKKGFRHCSVMFITDSGAIAVNSSNNTLAVAAWVDVASQSEMYSNAHKAGFTLVEVDNPCVRAGSTIPMLTTCTNIVKMTLGIHDRRIATPYQLYKYLLKRESCQKTNTFH